jgi:hypothetical protein
MISNQPSSTLGLFQQLKQFGLFLLWHLPTAGIEFLPVFLLMKAFSSTATATDVSVGLSLMVSVFDRGVRLSIHC